MTGRGKTGAPPFRPVTPLDETLLSRPVPRRRQFIPRSIGPAAIADVHSRVQPIRDLIASTDKATYTRRTDTAGYDPPIVNGLIYWPNGDDIRRLLEDCADWESVSFRSDERMPPPDPTWGFAIFVTAYDDVSREQLLRAMENWAHVQKRKLDDGFTLSAFAAEAWQRFKLDVIEDQEALDGASDDRVRAEFRALVHARELSDDEDLFVPPARNQACLVLDAAAIVVLADLKFPEDPKDDQLVFEDRQVKAIDVSWKRPQSSNSSYRGTGQLSINALARFYHLLTMESGYMEGMHPLDGEP